MSFSLSADKLVLININSTKQAIFSVEDKSKQPKIKGRAISTLSSIQSALQSNAQLKFANGLKTDICAIANAIYSRYEKRYNESWWQSIVDTFTRCFGGVTEIEKINEIRNQILLLTKTASTKDDLSSSSDSNDYGDSDILNLSTAADPTTIETQVIRLGNNHISQALQRNLQNAVFSIFDNSHFKISIEIFYTIFSFCIEDIQAFSLCSRTIHNMTDNEDFYKLICVKVAKIEIVPTQIWKHFFKNIYSRDIATNLKTITETRLSSTAVHKSAVSIKHDLLGLLPFEIFNAIFSFCNEKDLVKFSSVSIDFNNSETVSKLWRSICIREAPEKMNLLNTTWKNFCQNAISLLPYTGSYEIAIQGWYARSTTHFQIGVNFEKANIGHLKKLILLGGNSTQVLSEMQIIVGGKVANDTDKAGDCWKSIEGGCGRTVFHLISRKPDSEMKIV